LPVAGAASSANSDLPRQLASAQPAPAAARAPAASASGGYAVQFSAAASEQEAREKIAATQRRFADALGGRTPTFIKGEAGSRTVWRVRVGGMSREEASSMCQRIKGQGGDCFVAAN
jgi:cell division septation protein DedD